jgi:hypothetical protein
MAVKFAAVRRMALALDNVEEGTSYGTPAFKVGGVLFLRLHQVDWLVVRMDFEHREEMMAADPEGYYITDHYLNLNYPWMLVRLTLVHRDALRDLIATAWRVAARKRRGVRRGGVSGDEAYWHGGGCRRCNNSEGHRFFGPPSCTRLGERGYVAGADGCLRRAGLGGQECRPDTDWPPTFPPRRCGIIRVYSGGDLDGGVTNAI